MTRNQHARFGDSVATKAASTRPLSWVLAAKLAAVVIGLAVLLGMLFEHERLQPPLSAAYLVLAALLCNQLALHLFAVRMRGVLSLYGLDLPIREAVRIHLQSLFYFFFVPMGVGADVARCYKVQRCAPQSTMFQVVAAVMVDRVLGMTSALAVVALGAPGVVERLMNGYGKHAVAGALVGIILIAIAALSLATRHPKARKAKEILRRVITRPSVTGYLLIVSLVMYVLMGLATYIGGLAFGVNVSLWMVIVATATSVLGMLIPVSFAGVSVAEAASVGVFLMLGCPVGEAGTLALIGYFGRLVGAIEGGMWEVLETMRTALRKK